MGAGISKERERQIKYRNLKRIQRELAEAGIETVYENKTVLPVNATPVPKFSVSYGQTARMSNGEAFGNMVVKVVYAGGVEQYGFLDAGIGIRRIKAIYGNEGENLRDTEVEALVYKIEVACRSRDENVYLYDGGVRGRQVYCYNEFRDGKAMLRLDDGQYYEFVPGQSVRKESGEVVAWA